MRPALCLAVALVPALLPAQTEPRRHNAEERYRLFQQNLVQRAEAITAAQFRGAASLEDWRRLRPAVRAGLLHNLGLDPMPARTPLRARLTGGFDRDTYRVETLVFESRPGLYVTGNLYLPRGTGKVPAILYVSGHSPSPYGAKVDYQRHGQWFARNGYAALLLDTIEFGEIPGIHHGTHNLGFWHWLSLGYTPAGVEVWNAIRALDYLESRAEVDATRIGMTGRSGGGAITWLTAAVDERVQVAVPVHGTWSIGPHVANDVVRHNCDCIYFWNGSQLDLPVAAALIAPRPLKIVNASGDGAFPPSGYDKVHALLKPVYQWFGAPEKLAAYAEPTGHADLPAYRREANQWLSRWLKQETTPFDESGLTPEKPELLAVLRQTPADARNEGIDRVFVAAHALQAPVALSAWNARRAELLKVLRERVFRAFPSQPVPFATWKEPIRLWTRNYADSFHVEFSTESSVRVQGQLFVPRKPGPHPALIYVKGRDDLVFSVDYDDILSAFPSHIVLVLRPRGVDYPMDNFRLAVTKMTAALVGTTLESLQLWDLLRALDFLEQDQRLPVSGFVTYGRRDMSVLGLYAAALDARVTRVILYHPPPSHWDSPAFLNILRYTDLAEVAALAAPRQILSLSPLPASFSLTSAVYRLYPGARPPRTVASLGDALRVE